MLFQLSLVTLVGVLARLSGLTRHSIFLDEAISVEFVTRNSLAELAAFVRQFDVHPPLYYQMLLLWTRVLGTDLIDLRLPSALLGALSVPAVYVLILLLTRRRTAFLTALLFALSPFQLQVAQNARMYALLTFWVLLAAICLVVLLQQEELTDARPFWWGLVLMQGLALHTHSAGGLYLAAALNASMLWLLWLRRRGHSFPEFPALNQLGLGYNWGVSQLMVFVLWLPWFGSFLAQARRVAAEFWVQPVSIEGVWWSVSRLAFAYLPVSNVERAVPVTLLLLLAAAGLFRMRRLPVPLALTCGLLFMPVAVILALDWYRPLWHLLSFNYICVPLYLLAAVGVAGPRMVSAHDLPASGWRRRWQETAQPILQTTLILSISLLQIWGIVGYHRDGEREAWKETTALVAAMAKEGDAIVFQAGWTQLPFMYHYRRQRGPALKERPLPAPVFSGAVAEPKATRENVQAGLRPLAEENRIWLIYSHDWYTDPDQLTLLELRRMFPLRGEWHFRSIRLYLLGTT